MVSGFNMVINIDVYEFIIRHRATNHIATASITNDVEAWSGPTGTMETHFTFHVR